MSTSNRFGNRWTINECLQLQREFELLELSIDEIATRHKRTPNAIMIKLSQEGFADYNILYSNYYGMNLTIPVTNSLSNVDYNEQDDDYEQDDAESYTTEEYNNLKEHVMSLDEYVINLEEHIIKLEKQVNVLTEIIRKNSKNKSIFSFFD